MTFKEYNRLEILEAEVAIQALIYLSQDTINEGNIYGGFKDWLKNVGLNISTTKTPSIIDYAMDFTSGVGMIILAALKGDKAQVKAISNSYSERDFQDFLEKLDKLTLGLITIPIEFIQAITGWDILGSIKDSSKNTKKVLSNIKQAINNIKTNIPKIMDTNKQSIIKAHLSNIETNIPG